MGSSHRIACSTYSSADVRFKEKNKKKEKKEKRKTGDPPEENTVSADAHLGQLALEADARLALSLNLGGDALLAVAVVQEGLRNGTRLLPQPVVQEEAVHVGAQQRRAHQVPDAQLRQLSPRHKPAQRTETFKAQLLCVRGWHRSEGFLPEAGFGELPPHA